MSYDQVKKALADGADPAMLCMTCPWDRFCIQPPAMTRQEVDAQIKAAGDQDRTEHDRALARGEQPPGMPVGMLLTALTMAGRDSQAQVCPVFAARLRSSDGRVIVDGIRAQMTGWDQITS